MGEDQDPKDTEGHKKLPYPATPEDDTEGHKHLPGSSLSDDISVTEDDSDTEGHYHQRGA